MIHACLIASIATGLVAAAPARAGVITFDTAPLSGTGEFTGSVTEGLYTYSVLSGARYVAPNGNPGDDVEGYYPMAPGTQTGVLTISRTDGGTFRFDRLDFAEVSTGGNSGSIGSIEFFGFLDGRTVTSGGDIGTAASTYNWIPHAIGASDGPPNPTINALSISIPATTEIGPNGTFSFFSAIDNVVVTNVSPVVTPEPMTLAVLGAGLAGVRRCARV